MKKVVRVIGFVCCLVFFTLQGTQAHANSLTSVGIANYIPIQADKVEDGAIVIVTQQGYFLSSVPYDPQVIGVVSTKPAIALKTTTEKDTYPVVNFGSVRVKVSGVNGNIQNGDTITTSDIPGVGMKATDTGYVLGEAIQAVNFDNENDVRLVGITLNIHFSQVGETSGRSFLDILSFAKTAGYQQPIRVLQYIIAGIIVIASFVFGFLIFGKAVSTGIEALGRNPLAGRMIQLSIVFNVVLIIIIIMSGITLAYILIRL